jgi:nitrite reductase/ring-hydroxylating ferredoxin subunit
MDALCGAGYEPAVSAPATGTDVIHRIASADLPEHGSLKFEYIGPGARPVEAFCVRHDGQPYAWVNSCPHWGIGLDMDDGVFWSDTGPYLVCQNHAALFRPDDGYCQSGPCFGGFLTKVPLTEEDGQVTFFRPKWPDEADWL